MTVAVDRDPPRPLAQHLSELRRRSLVCLVAVAVGMAALLPFTPKLFAWLAAPLSAAMGGSTFIALSPFEAWSVYFRLATVGGVILAFPVVCGQLFAFFAPALSPGARRAAWVGGAAAGTLFAAGATFCYGWILPAGFAWAVAMTREMGAELLPSLDRYLSLAMGLIAAFGLAFELPAAVTLAVVLGLTTPAALRQVRPYVIVGAFVVAAILTPPDVLSQTALAIPLILLYELGIVVGALLLRRRHRREACSEDLLP